MGHTTAHRLDEDEDSDGFLVRFTPSELNILAGLIAVGNTLISFGSNPAGFIAGVLGQAVRFAFGSNAKQLLSNPVGFITNTIVRFVIALIVGTAVSIAGIIGFVFDVFTGAVEFAGTVTFGGVASFGTSLITAIVRLNTEFAAAISAETGIAALPIVIVFVVLELAAFVRIVPPVLRIVGAAVSIVPVVGPAINAGIIAFLEVAEGAWNVTPLSGEG